MTPVDEPKLLSLQNACRRWQVTSSALAGVIVLCALVAAAPKDKLPTILNGDVTVTGSLNCGQFQADGATINGDVSFKSKLTAEEIDSPTITKLRESIAALQKDLALSRPYVAATIPGVQDPPDNSNPTPFAVNGLHAEVPRQSLPAIVVAVLRIQRPPRRTSDGTMDVRLNGEVMSMAEIADFGHDSPNTYTSMMTIAPSDKPTTEVSVTCNTYNFGGQILSGSLVVIPLGSMPK